MWGSRVSGCFRHFRVLGLPGFGVLVSTSVFSNSVYIGGLNNSNRVLGSIMLSI